MDKVTLYGPSAFEPAAFRAPQYGLVSVLRPSLDLALKSQRLLSAVSVFLFLKTYLMTAIAVSSTTIVAKYLGIGLFRLVKTLIIMTSKGVEAARKTRAARRLRKRLEFEFAMTILGPGTNTMIIFVFWPGWWLVMGFVIAVKLMAG